jgi:spore germination protein YaaH
MRRSIALLAIAVVSGPATAAPTALAYYEGRQSNASLEAEATALNSVAADMFAVSLQGVVTGKVPSIVFRVAAANNIGVLAVVSNYAHNGFSSEIAKALLTPGPAQNAAIANIRALAAKGYAGINLDFEGVPHTYRAQYTAFAKRLAAGLHKERTVLVLSLPAKTADNPKDSWTGAYDFAALGQFTDTLQIMTYDENGPWGPPGPVAGLDWVMSCIDYTESVVPVTQISMGMPAYGYDWNLTAGTGTSVSYADIQALIVQTGALPQWNVQYASPWFTYTGANSSSHIVWYENAESITMKATFAAQALVASVSVYALGLDDTAYWQAVAVGLSAAQ